jgi:hypothetical protein
MWSGPRNISTAMMRSWENRPDTEVVDEPLYAHYLSTTGYDHPGRDAVLASQDHDWREVVADLTAELPAGRIFYQKHMTHHITADVELDWIDGLSNVFLIRAPEEVVRSYGKVRKRAVAEELGFVQQARIFDHVSEKLGEAPPVLDSRSVLENPEGVLRNLCGRLDIPFHAEMLEWPIGPRSSDGVWAPWWYASVEKSTTFLPYRPTELSLTDSQEALAEECRPHYDKLAAYKLEG